MKPFHDKTGRAISVGDIVYSEPLHTSLKVTDLCQNDYGYCFIRADRLKPDTNNPTSTTLSVWNLMTVMMGQVSVTRPPSPSVESSAEHAFDIHVQYASFRETVDKLLAGTNVTYCSDICMKDNTFMLELNVLGRSCTMFLLPQESDAKWRAHIGARINAMAQEAGLLLALKK